MALETGDYIADLVITNPTGSDSKTTGDDHIRLIKKCVQQSFPNVSGPVTLTAANLNVLAGLSNSITAADFQRLSGAGVTVTNYVAGATEWLEGDVGANSNGFTINARIGTATWVLVGPTTFAATATWTALDVVPSGAKWIRIKTVSTVSQNSAASGAGISYELHARKNGTLHTVTAANLAAYSYLYASSTASIVVGNVCFYDVPVDSNIAIDLYRLQTGTTASAVMFLCGWGK